MRTGTMTLPWHRLGRSAASPQTGRQGALTRTACALYHACSPQIESQLNVLTVAAGSAAPIEMRLLA